VREVAGLEAFGYLINDTESAKPQHMHHVELVNLLVVASHTCP
jgi:hypothetical protein